MPLMISTTAPTLSPVRAKASISALAARASLAADCELPADCVTLRPISAIDEASS
jgi:hypothetical protein